MSKKAMIVGSAMHTREYASCLSGLGVQVATFGNFHEALAGIPHFQPGVIAIILPNYYDEISAFVESVRGQSVSRSTPIVYIGGPVEGGNQTMLRSKGVKTLTLGPVQTDEMARFIAKQIY